MSFFKPASLLAALAFTAAAAFGSASVAADIVIKHKQGETALPAKPEKILVFDLASLDTLTALGVEVAGVPSGPKPDYLKSFNDAKYLKAGTLFEPDYEAVNAAEPDLIIVAGRSSGKYAELAKIAPTIDLSVDAKNFFPEAKANVETLGNLFDKKAQADALLAKLDSSVDGLKTLANGKGTGLFILTAGGKISAFGPGSRFGMIHSVYGIAPAAETPQAGGHGQAVSFEYILETNPDWLIVLDRDAAIGNEGVAAAQFLDNEIVRKTKAWQAGHLVYVDSGAWYLVGSGISAMQRTVDQLTTAFSKD
jgi:iron complex transport system substrate-binding protein